MRKTLLITVFVIVCGFAILVAWLRDPSSLATGKTVDLTALHLEIVDTYEARLHGLSDRESLDAQAGMLFLFEGPSIYPFWMKDMHFPLDIIWINGDRVVEITTLPPPDRDHPIPATHVPTRRADKVLEINAGKAKELGLQNGVRVILSKQK